MSCDVGEVTLRLENELKIFFPGVFKETKPNLMERFIGTDTASVELLFNIFTSGSETFVISWDQLFFIPVL